MGNQKGDDRRWTYRNCLGDVGSGLRPSSADFYLAHEKWKSYPPPPKHYVQGGGAAFYFSPPESATKWLLQCQFSLFPIGSKHQLIGKFTPISFRKEYPKKRPLLLY
jgi:hypothetical protein